jgi:hypothetical protein
VSEDLPKQELLIKLLKMSTSPNDGEALISIRKANDLLRNAGWDWDKLIHGKIKVIEDPFKSVEVPVNRNASARPAPPPPPRPRAQAPQPAAAPPPPRQPPPPPKPLGTKTNIYAGWCYCCGNPVQGRDGFLFDPSTKNRGAKSKLQIVCGACNNIRAPYIGATAYPRQRPLSNVTPSLSDI